MPEVEPLSLRERNKVRARAEIADVALELFCEHGFDGVTVDEIVRRAGVSRRTFFRYFDSKEDALLADYPVLLDRLTEAMLNRPADQPVLDAVRDALHRMVDYYEQRREAVLARSKLIKATSPVAARNLELLAQWEASIAEAVAREMGVADTELVPRAVAAVTVAAFRTALGQWVRASGQRDLHKIVDHALDLADAGLRAACATR